MDNKKIDLVLQYVLCVAGQEDDDHHELGMIHLIKYAYLADLSHAEHHGGRIHTGIPWRFYHYGPWSEDVYHRIEPALAAIGAQKREFHSSAYDKDISRWSVRDSRVSDRLDRLMDLTVAGAIQKYVRKFGNDTTQLLHFVYQTLPMLRAAPDEFLDFNTAVLEKTEPPCDNMDALYQSGMTDRQKKKRREKFLELKKRLNRHLDTKLREIKIRAKPPRYDDIFLEGIRQLDELAGVPVTPMDCTAIFPDEVWKSKARFDSDVS